MSGPSQQHSQPKTMRPPSPERQKQLEQYRFILIILLVLNVICYGYLNKDMLHLLSSGNSNEQLAFVPEGMFSQNTDRKKPTKKSAEKPSFVEVMLEGLCDECKAASAEGFYTCPARIERFFKKGGDFSAFVKAQDDVSKQFVKTQGGIPCAVCDPKKCKIAM